MWALLHVVLCTYCLTSIHLWNLLISCNLSLALRVVVGLSLILFLSYCFVGLLEREKEKNVVHPSFSHY